MKLIPFILILAILLTGCGRQAEPALTEDNTTSAEVGTTEPAPAETSAEIETTAQTTAETSAETETTEPETAETEPPQPDNEIIRDGNTFRVIRDGNAVEYRFKEIFHYDENFLFASDGYGRCSLFDSDMNFIFDFYIGSEATYCEDTSHFEADYCYFEFALGDTRTSYRYSQKTAPISILPEQSEPVLEMDECAIYYADGTYYLMQPGAEQLLVTDLPDLDYIEAFNIDNFAFFMDPDYTVHFIYSIWRESQTAGEWNLVGSRYLTIDTRHDSFGAYTAVDTQEGICFLFNAQNESCLRMDDSTYTILGDLIGFSNYVMPIFNYTVYNSKLEPISEELLTFISLLDDNRLLAAVTDTNTYRIYSPDGALEFESEPFDGVLFVINDTILVNDGGELKLLDLNGETLAVFCEWTQQMSFHWMLSGYFDKRGDNKDGYYFVCEDSSKNYEEAGIEYYYIPETGETGYYEIGEIGGYAKPVLYLYPTEETEVTVTFEHPERLTTVYPAYDSGWTVTAQPDGTLSDGRREYYALYWEERAVSMPDLSTGFCIAAEDAARFLEDKLDALGFTQREANEFIMYWLPILEQSEYNLVHFELTESREAANALHISPAPDSLLRVAIHIVPLSGPIEIAEQPLPRFERVGFAAVEWGGRRY